MTFRLIILALTILAFTTKSDKVVTGKISSSENPQYYSVENILVILRCDNKPLYTVWAYDNGEFSAIVPSGKQKGIGILYSSIGLEQFILNT